MTPWIPFPPRSQRPPRAGPSQRAGPSRPRQPPDVRRVLRAIPPDVNSAITVATLAPAKRCHLAIAIILLFFTTGCPSKPVDDNRPPNLRDLKSRIPMDLPPTELGRGPTVKLRIGRFDLPAGVDIAKAWNLARSAGIEPPMATAWRDNGLRACVINEILLDDFFELLPASDLAHLIRMTASDIPTPIETRFAIKHPMQIDLNLPGMPTQPTVLRPGQCRFLVEAQPEAEGSALVFLTPQHHYGQASIVPRPNTEKQLDGRVFHELTLQARLAPKQALLVGLFAPKPPPPPTLTPPPPVEGEPAATQPAADAGSPASSNATEPPQALDAPAAPDEPPPPPMNIGRLTLEASRFARPIQILFVIMIDTPTP